MAKQHCTAVRHPHEELLEVAVVWPFVKLQVARVLKKHLELGRVACAQFRQRCRLLLLHNLLVFLLLVGRFEALPWQ